MFDSGSKGGDRGGGGCERSTMAKVLLRDRNKRNLKTFHVLTFTLDK